MAAAPPQVQEADLMPLAEALKLLGLQEGASQEQIRAAYKARLLRLHPDKQQAARAKRSATAPSQNTPTGDSATGGGSGSGEAAAAAAFHRLQAAYRALTAPPPEQRFDALVANGRAFSREVLDEALRQGLGPADVAAIQQTVEAFEAAEASGGAPPPAPPPEELLVWRQLHKSIQRRRRREEREAAMREEQAAAGQGPQRGHSRGEQGPSPAWATLKGMVSDLLLSTPADLWVPEDFGAGRGTAGPGLEVAAPASPSGGADPGRGSRECSGDGVASRGSSGSSRDGPEVGSGTSSSGMSRSSHHGKVVHGSSNSSCSSSSGSSPAAGTDERSSKRPSKSMGGMQQELGGGSSQPPRSQATSGQATNSCVERPGMAGSNPEVKLRRRRRQEPLQQEEQQQQQQQQRRRRRRRHHHHHQQQQQQQEQQQQQQQLRQQGDFHEQEPHVQLQGPPPPPAQQLLSLQQDLNPLPKLRRGWRWYLVLAKRLLVAKGLVLLAAAAINSLPNGGM